MLYEVITLGCLVTDIMRAATGAEVALTNRSGLRAGLPAGRLTRREMYQISPFGNTLVVPANLSDLASMISLATTVTRSPAAPARS